MTKKHYLLLLDMSLIILLTSGISYFLYTSLSDLNYQWDWASIPQFLIRFDPSGSMKAGILLQGLIITLKLSVWAIILGLIIGLIMGLFRTSKSKFRNMIGRTYVESIRNLPPLVLIFIFYFFISEQITRIINVEEFAFRASPLVQESIGLLFAPPSALATFISGVIALALYEGAYIAEIVRSGIESIHQGQWEAGNALGLSKYQLLRKVILPQALYRVLPPLAGQFISTIKDSAILSIISIPELAYKGSSLIASTYLAFETWITVFLMYLVICWLCSLVVMRLEKKFAF